MNGNRLWMLGSALLIVGLIAGSWFIGISPKLDEAALANTSREGVEAQNSVQAATLASLKKEFEGLDDIREQLEDMQVVIPAGADLSPFISQVNKLAQSAGVVVDTLSFAMPTPYVPSEQAAADAELSAALGSVTPENFLVIAVDLKVLGTHAQTMDFLAALQKGPRYFLAHDLSGEAMVADSQVSLSITGQVFVHLEGATAPTTPEPAGVDAPVADADNPQ